ncbi:hypothetical protein PIIN_07329 [Serendipita indica DSM 11827]|uniref:Uncharacterized protein n=1 Tax=Serendipita indica (strain DSM 11827) TaxID=1109443 RepID=G4TPX8_SERID|nr:hypothetical protein PIIN_07329 [Serendipita indica DSM 11827]
MDSYSNDTQKPFALYDLSGILLEKAGVGLGKPVCMCFSLGVITTGEKLDICWGFDLHGAVIAQGGSGVVYGSWRTSGKALARCANVNLASLEAQWSQTAVIPSYTGAVQTLNLGPSTVTQVQTVTITPTIATFNVTSTTVFTGSNGQIVTQPVTYVTTAPVIGSGGKLDLELD